MHAAVALELRHLEDGVDRFFLGVVDEGARVDDDDVGVRGVGRDLVTRVARKAEHDLAVDEVLRATEGNEANFMQQLRSFSGSSRLTGYDFDFGFEST